MTDTTPTVSWGPWFHGTRPVPELVRLACAAEAAGASTILLADEGIDRDIYVVFAAIAAATERVILIPGITNPFSRHPVATAAALASLEELAPGRVVAGLGAGGSMVLGPMAQPVAHRYRALVESVDVIGRLLAGETVSHCGEFGVDRARLPWSPGRLPIGIAGRGPKVQDLAADTADWLILSGKKLAAVGPLVDAVAARARLAGRTAPRVIWNPGALWTDQAIAEARPRYTYMSIDMPAADRARLGIDDQIVEEMRRLLLTGGPEAAAHLVPDAVLDEYAIAGARHDVVDRLARAIGSVAPDVVAFDVHEYSTEFVTDLADLVAQVERSLADHPTVATAGAVAVQTSPD
jgi:5,10-methylenetetrahydromethanopterin reductase